MPAALPLFDDALRKASAQAAANWAPRAVHASPAKALRDALDLL